MRLVSATSTDVLTVWLILSVVKVLSFSLLLKS